MRASFANAASRTERVATSRRCRRRWGNFSATVTSCVGVFLFCLTAPNALAHTDPPGAVDAAVSHTLGVHYDADCALEIEPDEVIAECQTVYVQATLIWFETPTTASIESGGWFLMAFDLADVPYLLADLGPVPCIGDPVNSTDDPLSAVNDGRGLCAAPPPSFASACVPYTVTAADVARGAIVLQAVWGGELASPYTGWAHLGEGDMPGQGAVLTISFPVGPCDAD